MIGGSRDSAPSPLHGLTVVEVAEGVAGPFCGRMLAAFGATVIKLERPPAGDRTRAADPVLPGVKPSEASALFLYLNMGKRSVLCDWRRRSGRARFDDLLSSADVLIEDWDSDTRSEMEANQVHAPHQGLIDVSVTPFGTFGPYSRWWSTPLVSLALGGFLYLSGDEDREPLMIPGYQSEYLAGLHAYSGTMLALRQRDSHGLSSPPPQRSTATPGPGHGRFASQLPPAPDVEVSEIESLTALHQFTTVMHTYGGLVRRRHGARWENQGAYGRYPITVLPCKDGYVSFAVSTEGQWDMLFPMVGKPELLEESRFATFVERRENADEIDVILIDWMKDKTRQEVFELAAGTWSEPASPLLSLSEVLNDPQLRHRGLFTELDHPHAGTLTFPTVPFHMTATPPVFDRAPTLGEHTDRYTHPARTDRAERADRGQSDPPSPISDHPSTAAIPVLAGRSSLSPLSGVRVLDLTRVWAGPLATRIMADFGAEVVKISDPRVPIDRSNGTNNKLNRNKSNLAIRLDRESGRRIFLDLVANSDIVVENFRPRVMHNFRLTYNDLRQVRPDIIMCSMPGFGTTGDYRDYPAFGPSVEAMTGLPSMMGYANGPPRTSSLAFPDLVAGLNSVAAMITALHHRMQTGVGQFIDLALTEGPICQIGERIAAHSRTGKQPALAGNSHPRDSPYGVYPARGDDEWVAVCVTSDDAWRELRGLLEASGTTLDPAMNDAAARRRSSRDLDHCLSEWTKERDAGEIAALLQSHGIASGRVSKNWQLLEDPHLDERGFFVDLEEPDVGVKTYPGQAIRHVGVVPSNWRPSARLGEHTVTILEHLLGLDTTQIGQLAAVETIGTFS